MQQTFHFTHNNIRALPCSTTCYWMGAGWDQLNRTEQGWAAQELEGIIRKLLSVTWWMSGWTKLRFNPSKVDLNTSYEISGIVALIKETNQQLERISWRQPVTRLFRTLNFNAISVKEKCRPPYWRQSTRIFNCFSAGRTGRALSPLLPRENQLISNRWSKWNEWQESGNVEGL